VEAFVLRLKRREVGGSNAVAFHTAELLRAIVSRRKYATVTELLTMVRNVGKALEAAHPIELACGNIVRRVLYIVRHETAALIKEAADGVARDSSVQQASVDLSLSLLKTLDRPLQADEQQQLDTHTVQVSLGTRSHTCSGICC
jgi:translation initiation factor eIF-2B subunit beta